MNAPRTRAEREAFARSTVQQVEHERVQVAAHYEHDPAIFSMVLDRRLAYATGVFQDPAEDLETAQERKFARIKEKLAIAPGERMLDVGCGWGSNLLYLAQHTEGCVHGITLSEKQREVALARAHEWGVASRVRVDVQHVEELDFAPESLDAALFSGSIVHMHNREAIHRQMVRLLRPGGRILISDCLLPRAGARKSREHGHAVHFRRSTWILPAARAERGADSHRAGWHGRHPCRGPHRPLCANARALDRQCPQEPAARPTNDWRTCVSHSSARSTRSRSGNATANIPADTAQRQLRVQKRRAMALAAHEDADGASVRKRKKPFVL